MIDRESIGVLSGKMIKKKTVPNTKLVCSTINSIFPEKREKRDCCSMLMHFIGKMSLYFLDIYSLFFLVIVCL